MPERIFFQSSLPRAGSTLLQNILGQNPEFYVTPTSGVLELIYAARVNYTNSPEFKAQDQNLMKLGFIRFCHDGIFGFYNAITNKKYVLDKSRGWGIHYGFLNEIEPDPKIICMVRDLKDIYASLEKKFRNNQLMDSGIVDHAKMQGTTTEKRIDIWANSQPVGLAIERLQQIFKEGNNKHMLFIRYEDLITNPRREMERIYSYLELPLFYHSFDRIEQITKEDDSVYGIYGDHTIRTKLEGIKSDAREVLGDNICNWIDDRYKWYYDIFYKKS
jgi:sulfotransferase